jgi:hypothetical protein
VELNLVQRAAVQDSNFVPRAVDQAAGGNGSMTDIGRIRVTGSMTGTWKIRVIGFMTGTWKIRVIGSRMGTGTMTVMIGIG